jgi:preprotein translocase subunit SecD
MFLGGDSGGERVVVGQWVVELEFTPEGAQTFADLTAGLAVFPFGDPRRQLAVVLDGVLLSAPAIAEGVDPEVGITGGNAIITLGSVADSQAAARGLAAAVKSSALPLAVESITILDG